jgi:hypothetical protein
MDDIYTNKTTNFDRPMSFLESVAHTELDWDNGRQIILLLGAGLLVVAFYVVNVIRHAIFSVKAPVVGYKHFWEPGWVVGMRFAKASGPMVREGYTKVCKCFFDAVRLADT